MPDRSETGDPSALRLRDPFQLSGDGGLLDAALGHAHRQLVQGVGWMVDGDAVDV